MMKRNNVAIEYERPRFRRDRGMLCINKGVCVLAGDK
ncbi:hypothetical protein J2S90_002597 [Arthrobacter bambusae]|uniref:Uncharacterized protein n=1 Tax=Arthrobacter bambusae TaxID=1338426 RepID=A0AAW8DIW9_9MICC|nr:hypothetical protein [Arthrobacter bambusae]MDQ0127292.1 hypothetical protein [Arthrobacter bambusae]MDQ0178634.1 hypothetical protein [Arthrobacter bambusae]